MLAAVQPGLTPEVAAAVDETDEQQGPGAGRKQGAHCQPLPQHDGRAWVLGVESNRTTRAMT